MYTNRENLEAIFRMIDLDSNGLISIDEFKQACELLSGEITTSNLSIVMLPFFVLLKFCGSHGSFLIGFKDIQMCFWFGLFIINW